MRHGSKAGWVFLAIGLGLLLVVGAWRFWQTDLSARQSEQRHKFGAVYMTLNNPFYEVIDEEIRATIEERGDVLLTRNPPLSVERQIEEVRDLLAAGVEVLFINPVDWRELAPALDEARRMGVPVICIDTSVADEYADTVAATVESDNYLAGVQCARHLQSHASGGHIAILQHSEARSSVDRIQGFCDTIAGDERFRIVATAECGGQLEQAMPAMRDMLREHPEIDVVMALNDPAAMGALAAIAQAGRLAGMTSDAAAQSGRRPILVYGVDGVPETKEMIASGHMTATAGQSPRTIGRLAVDIAYRILQGDAYPREVKLPTELITRENVAAHNQGRWD